MQNQRNGQRRPHGTGSLFEKGDNYYGQWRVHGKLVKRVVGPVRAPWTCDGLTRSQAEARLQALMSEVAPPVAGVETVRHESLGPREPDVDADIRFLDESEVNALLRFTPDTDLGRVERVLYLAAALIGMR